MGDITAGLFLVIVINGAAGSNETDDSWQKQQFKGGSKEEGLGRKKPFWTFKLSWEEIWKSVDSS